MQHGYLGCLPQSMRLDSIQVRVEGKTRNFEIFFSRHPEVFSIYPSAPLNDFSEFFRKRVNAIRTFQRTEHDRWLLKYWHEAKSERKTPNTYIRAYTLVTKIETPCQPFQLGGSNVYARDSSPAIICVAASTKSTKTKAIVEHTSRRDFFIPSFTYTQSSEN